MNYLTNHEADETPSTWPVCDRCHEPAERLESVGECEQAEDWCLSCLKEEAERMREDEDRDAEMQSLKGYYSSELDRI
jgi:hypothetical protein